MIRRLYRDAARAAFVAALAAALAACVSAPVHETPAVPWPERRAALQAESSFALHGRVAISTPGAGFNASLRWQQQGEVSQVSLDGPLGVGGAQIEVGHGNFALRTSRGEHLEGDAARVALEQRLGFPLPLAELRYWIRGVPAPGVAADEVLDEGRQRITRLVQQGWAIDYNEYLEGAAGSLPRRVSAQRGDTRVRVVVDRWAP